jgi:hypothetical protein
MKIVYTIHPVEWDGKETTEVVCYVADFYKHDNGWLCMDNDDSRYASKKLFIPASNVKAIKHA